MGTPFSSIADTFMQSAISGVYERRDFGRVSGPSIHQFVVETVRLDVDGWYPQKMASGSYFSGVLAGGFVEWASNITESSPGVWEGWIDGKWGDRNLLPHKKIKIVAPRNVLAFTQAELTITFEDGAPPVTRSVYYVSPYFRAAEIEWDTVEGATRVTQINTGDHPNRPSALRVGPLSFIEVFSRAGVDLKRSAGDSVVPISLSNPDAVEGGEKWSDFELNEAMKTHWSHHAQSRAEWAMWLLFAGLHEASDTRGIMFDSKGIYKRQGAAVFNDWWLDDRETMNFENRDAHIRRRRFVTACHETGHCFDLIHSWEKAASGWWPLGGEPFAASFMNNPENAPDTRQFFRDFEYRFSNQELKFIRHAPMDFIEMGGMLYGDNFADRLMDSLPRDSKPWLLEATVRRRTKVFDFLEPVMLDLRLTNQSDRPQVVDENLFHEGRNLNVAIRRSANVSVMLRPFVIRCLAPKWRVLHPGESLNHTAIVSAGIDGWLISEPGPYQVRVALNAGTAQALADPLILRVATPTCRDEENIAQDFFTDDIGRALAFGGAAEGTQAYATLEKIIDRFGESRVARQAQLALGLPKMKPCKRLRLNGGEYPTTAAAAHAGSIEIARARIEEARLLLEQALREGDGLDTFGTNHLARINRLVKECLDREDAFTAKKMSVKAKHRDR